MSRLPNDAHATIEDRKLTAYLLSFEHPLGQTKARYFTSFGFRRSNSGALKAALLEQARQGEVTNQVTSSYGIKFIVDGPLPTPDGRNPLIRSVWLIADGEEHPRFVTAYPIGGQDDP